MLMTGLAGLLLTSTTGAKIQLTPRARASSGGDASLAIGPWLRSGSPYGHVPGQGKGMANAEGGTPLEVGSDQQGNRGLGLQSVDEDGGLVDVSLEENEAAYAGFAVLDFS